MKATLIVMIGSFGMLLNTYSLACSSWSDNDQSVYQQAITYQCTDPGFRWNSSIEKSNYCETFGNIGAI